MITEPKMLSDCGTCLVMDDSINNRYQISIASGDYILVTAGAKVHTPASKFNHPNVIASVKKVFEFKHYRASGSKFWTSCAGIEHIFLVPKTAIKMLPEKGYSYIPVEINGVKTIFNVSGGTANGWTDFLNSKSQIKVGHPLRDLKKIAEVSVRNVEIEKDLKFETSKDELARWNRLVVEKNPELKRIIAKMIDDKKCPKIVLLSGYSYQGDTELYGVKTDRQAVRIPIDKNKYRIEWTGKLKKIITSTYANGDGPFNVRVKLSQIDWEATAKVNEINA